MVKIKGEQVTISREAAQLSALYYSWGSLVHCVGHFWKKQHLNDDSFIEALIATQGNHQP